MISEINIRNFKSIIELQLNLGRVNILIGANGCGKTNILEAIAIASAANQNRLDDEYLGARLRMSDPDFMYTEFNSDEDNAHREVIGISIVQNQKPFYFKLFYNKALDKWQDVGENIKNKNVVEDIRWLVENSSINNLAKHLDGITNLEEVIKSSDSASEIQEKIPKLFHYFKQELYNNPLLDFFLIFSPEESNLRKFSDETMIRPLGRRGEGMFRHLKELLTNGDKKKIIHALSDGLSLLDWFKGFDIPKDLFTQEARLDIRDRFLKEAKQVFDQRSTNEGFLYLLFYLTLFNSEKTPSFFAIDNIETSLNPKLSRRLLQHLVEVAKKTNKQVIITTHSPYVLDGLDLSDDEQRLFVVRRNIDGHTKVSRVPYKENRKLPLSEIWMSGVLGGLPDNF